MDLDDPQLTSLVEEWHGKDMKDMLVPNARILYKAYLHCKEEDRLGSSSSNSYLGVHIKEFKVVSKEYKESKKWGHKINKAWIQADDEQLINSGKIMQMSKAFPPLISLIFKEVSM